MSTVMVSEDGKRRCDATCHRAKHPACLCICGGKHHGAQVLAPADLEGLKTNFATNIKRRAALRNIAGLDAERCTDQPLLFEGE